MSITRFRNDFPILKRKMHGKPLVYLDHAATTQKPRQVIDAMTRYYRRSNANVHRGIFTLAEEATAMYEGARARVAEFIGASDSAEIIFVRNTTEAINLVAQSFVRPHRQKPGARSQVLLTVMEHHSNMVPWMMRFASPPARGGVRGGGSATIITPPSLPSGPHPRPLLQGEGAEQRGGGDITYIPMTKTGTLDLSTLDALITRNTAIVAVTHSSNVLGTVNDIPRIVRAAHAKGVPLLVDAAQTVGHLPINVQKLGCDFLVFSGHKMYGPTGIGVLWGRRALLEAMSPFLGGGGMIRSVAYDGFTPNDLPWKFEAGTPHIAGAIGLSAAVAYLVKIGMDRIVEHEAALTAYAIARLRSVRGLTLYGPSKHRLGVLSFALDGIHPHDLATLLDRDGIAIRAGHHCAEPLVRSLGHVALARASIGLTTTRQEIDALVRGIAKVKKILL